MGGDVVPASRGPLVAVGGALVVTVLLVAGLAMPGTGRLDVDSLREAAHPPSAVPPTSLDPATATDVDGPLATDAPVDGSETTTTGSRSSNARLLEPSGGYDDWVVDTAGGGGPPATPPPQDADDPAVVARPVPVEPPPPPPQAPPPAWADSRTVTAGGHLSTDVGCAPDDSVGGLDAFLAWQVGPVLGWDYQHVYDLGGDRRLWLFQDTFIDQSGTARTLDKASFVHNAALIQEGSCFRLLHGGTAERPAPFEQGTGTRTLQTWFWPMGGEVHGGRLHVFWAQMVKDPFDPSPPDGLGWHPSTTYVATYDPVTLARLDFRPAVNSGVRPIYGYAVASDDTHTYLFGNTFEQNLTREGGWANGPHSGTLMFLARVPKGRLFDAPEYWRPEGWDPNPAGAQPFLARHWAEFPMQPRFIGGQWVASTAVNGYWGDSLEIDVARTPWGPWTTIEARGLAPRNADPKMNTYHAHLLPRLDASGALVVSVSNNARNMLRDAWPAPYRYRPMVFRAAFQVAPPLPPPTTTLPPSTTAPSSTTTTTTAPPTTTTTVPTTTTSTPSGTTTTTPPTTTTTTTTVPPATTTTTTLPDSTTTTSTSPPTTTTTTTTTVAASTTTTTVAPAAPTSARPTPIPDPDPPVTLGVGHPARRARRHVERPATCAFGRSAATP